MVFAAQIACWTSTGASAGAAALPSGSSLAFVPGTVMFAGGGGTYWVPPVDGSESASAVPGRIKNAKNVRANARSDDKSNNLFRRPAGLADGLALKEPAPHVALDVTRPNNNYLGPPPPGLPTQRFGLARHPSTWRRQMSSRPSIPGSLMPASA